MRSRPSARFVTRWASQILSNRVLSISGCFSRERYDGAVVAARAIMRPFWSGRRPMASCDMAALTLRQREGAAMSGDRRPRIQHLQRVADHGRLIAEDGLAELLFQSHGDRFCNP